MKRHHCYHVLAFLTMLVYRCHLATPNLTLIETAVFMVGFWIMAEISEMREELK